MKTIWIPMFIAFSLFFLGCNGQIVDKKNEDTQSIDTTVLKNFPKNHVKVNKEYDKDGNLVRFDSTYTYYYSNIDGNKITEDSIFGKFRDMFELNYPFSAKSYFDDLFFEDSLLQYDFYKKDFFHDRFTENMERMNKLFGEMDSLKNTFFMEQFNKKSKKK